MSIADARVECERWFAYLDKQREKSIAMQKIASARRAGTMDLDEARRQQRALDGNSVTVFDGARLEQAVRTLLKHVR
jgi:hypothetical protein